MKFGAVPLADALGATLAHGVPVASLPKGITLEEGHLAALTAFGFQEVVVARLEDGDVGEDAAATRLAQGLVPDAAAQGLWLTTAKAGRVNIMAHRAGLAQLDVARITALNRIDPMITVATVPDLKRVTAGVMLATIKVISYGVSEAVLDNACALVAPLGEDAPMSLAPMPFVMSVRQSVLKTASLIETLHPGQRIQPKGRRVLDERMDRLGCTLVETLDVPHDESAIAEAIQSAAGEVVFLLTASATCDPKDTAPNALRLAGGVVQRFGMPVDPGNLMFLGTRAHGQPVIGLPGCARSPALNGADWVLERIICGLPVGDDLISALGVGGLLKDIPDRGRKRMEP